MRNHHRQPRHGHPGHGWPLPRTWLSFVLMLLLVLPLSTLAACKRSQFKHYGQEIGELLSNSPDAVMFSNDADGKMTALGIIQAMVQAINNDDTCKAMYDSLPSSAIKDIDFSTFQKYIGSLRPRKQEKIYNIRRLTESQKKAMVFTVSSVWTGMNDLAQNSQFFYLDYVYMDLQPTSIVVALQSREDGTPYFSPDWVNAINTIADFSALYFNAIQTKNLPALEFILAQGNQPTAQPTAFSSIAKEKARIIYDYYCNQGNQANYLLRTDLIMPGVMRIQQEFIEGKEQATQRLVSIYRINGKYTIAEPIESNLKEEDSQLYAYGLPLSDLSTNPQTLTLSSDDLQMILGKVKSLTETDEEGSYQAEYFGLKLLFKGTADLAAQTWQGEIRQIEVSSRIYSFGPNQHIQVGSPVAQLLTSYPFADATQYTLAGTFQGQKVQLSMITKDERIERMVWILLHD